MPFPPAPILAPHAPKKNGPGCHTGPQRWRATHFTPMKPGCPRRVLCNTRRGITSLLLRLTLLDAFAADLELDAPVALAAGRGVVGIHRIGFAEALDRGDAAGRDAVRGEVRIDDVGTTLRQRLVVLRAALRVGVAVDLDLHLRIT